MSTKRALLAACAVSSVGLVSGVPAASAAVHYGESYTFTTYGGCSGTITMKTGSGKRWAVGAMACGSDMSLKGLSASMAGPSGTGLGVSFMFGTRWPTLGTVTTSKVNAVPGNYMACMEVQVPGPKRGTCTAYRYR